MGAHDDLFDVDRNFSIFLFSNKRSRGCTLNQTVSASVCLFWIYTILHTLFVCLSPITWTGHITLPFPAQHSTSQNSCSPRDTPPFPQSSHPGITSSRASKHRRLTRLGQHHATAGQTKESHTPSPSRIPASQPIAYRKEEQFCLSSRSCPTRIFRNVKANGRGESRAASVCLCRACQFCAHLHLVPAPCTIPAYARFSGGYPTIGQQREAQGRQSASQPTTTHRLILPLSPDPVVGLGSPTTDARVPYIPFWGRILGGDSTRTIKIAKQHEHIQVASSPIPPFGP